MVTQQKEVYYRLVIGHLDLTEKLTTGDNYHGLSPTIPRVVTKQPEDFFLVNVYFDLLDNNYGTITIIICSCMMLLILCCFVMACPFSLV